MIDEERKQFREELMTRAEFVVELLSIWEWMGKNMPGMEGPAHLASGFLKNTYRVIDLCDIEASYDATDTRPLLGSGHHDKTGSTDSPGRLGNRDGEGNQDIQDTPDHL